MFVSPSWLPKAWIATSLGLTVLIRADHTYHLPTVARELEHYEQCMKGHGIIHFCQYHLSTAYKFRCEAAAFATEIRCYGEIEVLYRTALAVEAMLHCYGLNCPSIHARDAILIELNKSATVVN